MLLLPVFPFKHNADLEAPRLQHPLQNLPVAFGVVHHQDPATGRIRRVWHAVRRVPARAPVLCGLCVRPDREREGGAHAQGTFQMQLSSEHCRSVRLQVARVADAAGHLQFAVIDTGAGIAEEEKAAVFQAFQQTQSGVQSREGTGLGMALSQKFV